MIAQRKAEQQNAVGRSVMEEKILVPSTWIPLQLERDKKNSQNMYRTHQSSGERNLAAIHTDCRIIRTFKFQDSNQKLRPGCKFVSLLLQDLQCVPHHSGIH